MKNKFSRREAVKSGTLILGGIGMFGLVACKDKKTEVSGNTTTAQAPKPSEATGDGDPLVSVDHPTAKSLKYVHDGSQVDPKLRVEKSGVAGNDQNCANCQFYKPVEGKEYGVCQLIPVPGKHVTQNGWCMTWAKKS